MKQSTNRTLFHYTLMVLILGTMAICCLTASADSRADGAELMAEVDAMLEEITQKGCTGQDSEPYVAADPAQEEVSYTWNQEIFGKVTAFEVGWCCKQCQYYVASACIKRFYEWYGQDSVAMVTDGNDQYYQMNPDYVFLDEANGFNFWEHYEEIMEIVDYATYHPLNCYFWDNEDTQSEWAELIWHCPEDGCWFYR